jgi:hypothetical protein
MNVNLALIQESGWIKNFDFKLITRMETSTTIHSKIFVIFVRIVTLKP